MSLHLELTFGSFQRNVHFHGYSFVDPSIDKYYRGV